jgi:hypothetical protein
LFLDCKQTTAVVAVSRLHAPLPLFHHKIHIGAAC